MRCCCTAGSLRRNCGCGCGSRTGACDGWRVGHEPSAAPPGGRAMSRSEPDDWHEPETDWDEPVSPRWPLSCEGLYPRERWMWFEQLWSDVCVLRARYHLALRSGWWEDQVQLEALAALAAWVERYDSGEWDDPP